MFIYRSDDSRRTTGWHRCFSKYLDSTPTRMQGESLLYGRRLACRQGAFFLSCKRIYNGYFSRNSTSSYAVLCENENLWRSRYKISALALSSCPLPLSLTSHLSIYPILFLVQIHYLSPNLIPVTYISSSPQYLLIQQPTNSDIQL